VQRSNRGWKGGIVTNANCASIMAVMPLGAAARSVRRASSLRGHHAGRLGRRLSRRSSLDILGNVIPYIGGEEGKIESEIQKMLGRRMETHIEHAPITISAHANRVPVENGHTVVPVGAISRSTSMPAPRSKCCATGRATSAPAGCRAPPSGRSS
jgi:aspartate-semialdehyde dehydrogenase